LDQCNELANSHSCFGRERMLVTSRFYSVKTRLEPARAMLF
jgi:hypothetical protein